MARGKLSNFGSKKAKPFQGKKSSTGRKKVVAKPRPKGK